MTAKAKVRAVKFSPAEMAYEIPADTSRFKLIGRGHAAIAGKTSAAANGQFKRAGEYLLCIDAGKAGSDVVVGKVYRTAKSLRNDPAGEVRLIDESGEDYLYPAKWFVPVELPAKAKRALQAH